jgi:hypothetical protein
MTRIIFAKIMASEGQRRIPRRTAPSAAILVSGAMLFAAAVDGETLATTTERVVTDSRTGLAIYGFDPVVYFIDATATPGRPDFEFRYRDAVWRFRNPGNRAAFAEHPTDYEPQFGGYDPVAIARSVPTPGNPRIWLIAANKLYLFYREETRAEFAANADGFAALAAAKWGDVLEGLVAR